MQTMHACFFDIREYRKIQDKNKIQDNQKNKNKIQENTKNIQEKTKQIQENTKIQKALLLIHFSLVNHYFLSFEMHVSIKLEIIKKYNTISDSNSAILRNCFWVMPIYRLRFEIGVSCMWVK